MSLVETSGNTASLEDRISTLRSKLKAYEYDFKRTHNRKPTESDIKQNPIRDSYKEYDRLRREQKRFSKPPQPKRPTSAHSSNPPQPALPPPPTPKRERPASVSNTPSRTPRRSIDALPWDTKGLYESPSSTRRLRLFGNRLTRDAVGPTPQKTGRVLGIFDSFTDIDIDVTTTPTKSPSLAPESPSKPSHSPTEAESPSKRKIQRVSASPAGSFTTPRKRKHGDQSGLATMFETPTALRQRVVALDDSLLESPPAFRPPPKPKRGLSSILAELRHLDEHALDDDEEAMREMEMEAAGMQVMGKEKAQKKDAEGFDRNPEMPPLPPGAFEEEKVVDEKDEKEPEARVWKKKGLKRQTRRVKMRPVMTVPKRPGPELAAGDEDEEDGEEEEATAEEEKEAAEEEVDESASEFEGDDDDDNDDNNEGDDTLEAGVKRARKRHAEDVAAAKEKTLAEQEKDAAKKSTRKVSAAAHSHMNFRKLNIKNKNSKGKGGGGRFRRRR